MSFFLTLERVVAVVMPAFVFLGVFIEFMLLYIAFEPFCIKSGSINSLCNSVVN